MYELDQNLRGLPANREQVVSLLQSINAPHVAVPGKPAGPAQAYIVGLRLAHGFAAFVYLYLDRSADCAVYVPDQRSVPAEAYPAQESEAIAFVESMGFMMDDLSFPGLPPEEQERLLKTLPVFQKDPRLAASAAPSAAPQQSPLERLARLLASI